MPFPEWFTLVNHPCDFVQNLLFFFTMSEDRVLILQYTSAGAHATHLVYYIPILDLRFPEQRVLTLKYKKNASL